MYSFDDLFDLQIARPFQDKMCTILKKIYKCYCFFDKCNFFFRKGVFFAYENWAIYYSYIRFPKNKTMFECVFVISI